MKPPPIPLKRNQHRERFRFRLRAPPLLGSVQTFSGRT
jgi:hypothetical protein